MQLKLHSRTVGVSVSFPYCVEIQVFKLLTVQRAICFRTSKSAPRHVQLESKPIICCNVATVTYGAERRGAFGRVLTCQRGRGFERRWQHQSHWLPGATCVLAKRYKLMVITLLRLSLVLRRLHKGPCENNDSVAGLKVGVDRTERALF